MTKSFLMATALAVVTVAGIAALTLPRPANAQPGQLDIVVHTSPACPCCENWVGHIEEAGHNVTIERHQDMVAFKTQAGVPERMFSCHTAEVGSQWVEGHVPVDLVESLVSDRQDAAGVAVPGMPLGSPGMPDAVERDPYEVFLFWDDLTVMPWHTR